MAPGGEPACELEHDAPNVGVLGGITIGVVAAVLWQRYYRIKLPPWLAFFGGRRFVPIITASPPSGSGSCSASCGHRSARR